jgi:hypothetical protein
MLKFNLLKKCFKYLTLMWFVTQFKLIYYVDNLLGEGGEREREKGKDLLKTCSLFQHGSTSGRSSSHILG